VIYSFSHQYFRKAEFTNAHATGRLV